jgi:glutaredoxin 3
MGERPKVVLYSNPSCMFCYQARMLLTQKGAQIEDLVATPGTDRFDEMVERTGSRKVPQVFIGNTHVGGFDRLDALDRNGELDKLLAG